jgi:hypothetical protein
MTDSIVDTATHPELIEVITYIDDDDQSYDELDLFVDWNIVRGPRSHDGLVGNLSVMWNHCYEVSTGAIVMHCGDDIVFRTEGWDDVVRRAFADVPDNILFAFGRDGFQDGNNFGTHGFIHREWVEAVGYFVPPYFVSDYNDVFLNDVAKAIGRHREIPIFTEHMHYINGKAEIDQNTRERLERHQSHRPDELYYSDKVQGEVREAVERLLGVMQ